MMDIRDILLLAVGFAVSAAVFFLFSRRGERERGDEGLEMLMRTLNTQLQEQTVRIMESIGKARDDSREAIGTRFAETQKMLAESMEKFLRETVDLKAASGKMLEIGGDIRKLSDILQGPKSRGIFGEFQLELLLKDTIPADRFALQHRLEGGMVDAVIFLKDRLLCIDSKFPKENLEKYLAAEDAAERDRWMKDFRRDVKKHAASISRKYVIPNKTLDFAIMFVPSEAVFLEIVSDPELHRGMQETGVVAASPNFLFVYLEALAVGFRGLAVEERAQEIIYAISGLRKEFEEFHADYKVAVGHLTKAFNKSAETDQRAEKIRQTLDRLQIGSPSRGAEGEEGSRAD